jgi:3-oxoacyl-[acyl-carrier-protein] synthase II
VKRVVVTGAGAVSPLGIGATTLWEGLLAGKSGIAEIQNFDVSDLEVRIGGEVRNFDPKDHMDAKLAKRMIPKTASASVSSSIVVVAAFRSWRPTWKPWSRRAPSGCTH